MKWKICLLVMLWPFLNTFAQSPELQIPPDILQIGDSVPSELWNLPLQVVNHPEGKTSIKLNDYKGKFIILDFWGTFCQPCVALFPKMDSLQRKFKDRLQVLTVTNENLEAVKSFYLKIRNTFDIRLPSVVAGKDLSAFFGVRLLPTYIWVNPEGIINGRTRYHEVNEKNIAAFIRDSTIRLPEFAHEKPSFFDRNTPLLVDGNGGNAERLRYHSVLTDYLPGQKSMISTYPKGQYKNRRLLIRNLTAAAMYRIAYGEGKFPGGFPLKRTRIDVKDTALYRPAKFDRSVAFCYDLILPEGSSASLYKTMQEDLERCFTLRGKIEKRVVKCLALVGGDKTLLRSKGGKEELDSKHYWLRMTNQPFSKLVNVLTYYFQKSEYPLVDETELGDLSVDLKIEEELSDIAAVREALQKYDLNLRLVDREMDILILKDY